MDPVAISCMYYSTMPNRLLIRTRPPLKYRSMVINRATGQAFGPVSRFCDRQGCPA